MAGRQHSEIALAGAADHDAVQSFYSSVGYGGGLSADDRVLVARQARSIVAAVRLSSEAGTLVLRGMYVAEPLRGTGIGSKLLDGISTEIGSSACWCIPYTHLEDFYSRIGFHICECGEIPDFLAARKRQYVSAGREVTIMQRREGWVDSKKVGTMTDDHTDPGGLAEFRSRGARASVILHEEQLRRFLEVWQRAKESGSNLPIVADPDYASYDSLLHHVLRWAHTYLIWICEKLDLPMPVIEPVPQIRDLEGERSTFILQLSKAWQSSLRSVPVSRFSDQEYRAPWGVLYSIDAMLEHAVMHPMKHCFQLEEFLGER